MRLAAVTVGLVLSGTLVVAGHGALPAAGGAGGSGLHVDAAALGLAGPLAWHPDEHDGVAMTTDAPDLDELPDIHAVYVYPSDQPSRFAEYAAMFQAQHARADRHLSGATGMTFRWDKRLRSGESGALVDDITSIRSKSNLQQLSSSRQFGLVRDTLKNAGLTDPDKKYFVWLDAKSSYCGQAQTPEDQVRSTANKAEGTSIAVAYRPNGLEESHADRGGWCAPVVHELTHALGAVASWAPNNDGSGGHCRDDAQDLMCTSGPTPFDPDAPRTYDYNNDDYLDPVADLALVNDPDAGILPWWTVNLSRFLCPRSDDPTVSDCTKPNLPYFGETTTEPVEEQPTKGGNGGGGGKPTK